MNIIMIEAVKELGLLSVLVLGILGLCVWLVRYVAIKLSKEIDRASINLDKVCTSLDRHDERSSEAHKYQREEHKEMIATLMRLNGKIDKN